MVDVDLDPRDYEVLEKWYGMLFGNPEPEEDGKGAIATPRYTATSQDIMLYNKIAHMHIGTLKKNVQADKDKLKRLDDDDDDLGDIGKP